MTDQIEHIAKICHEANRAYCAALGDHSQPTWADAPDWQKQSAITGVKFIINNPDASPSASHDSWLAEKKRDGWRYGEVKDPVAKTHPCYVPYDQLPMEQRAKDYIFGAVVRAASPVLAAPKEGQHQGLPVAGYQPQSNAKVAKVNEFKVDEERLLRKIEALGSGNDFTADMRWASIAKTHFQEGFMALNRAVFQPGRVTLPEDHEARSPE
jgi:RyR domain